VKTTSPAGRAFVESQEGLVTHPYQDQLGYWTIGYGHRIPALSLSQALAQYPIGLTQLECDALLSNDLRVAEGGVNSLVHVDLTQGIFDALVDLCHNCGPACLVGTRCLADLNAGDFTGARKEFLGFVHGTDSMTGQRVVLPVLVERRKEASAQLWDAPDAVA
jgi:lysozyme